MFDFYDLTACSLGRLRADTTAICKEFIRAGFVHRIPTFLGCSQSFRMIAIHDLPCSTRVVIGDLNFPTAEATVAEWNAAGGCVRFVQHHSLDLS